MNNKFFRVLVFAVAGMAIGLTMSESFRLFAKLEGPRELLAYLSLATTVGLAFMGMFSLASRSCGRAEIRESREPKTL